MNSKPKQGALPSFMYTYKLIFIGDSGVGKTSIIKRIVGEEITRKSAPTVGIEYVNKVFEMKNGGKLMVQIWDTAGQEKYKAICSHHYKDAIGAIIVFDLTRYKTWENCKAWLQEFKDQAPEGAKTVMIGNKYDIIEKEGETKRVPKAEIDKWCKENDIGYFECSAVKNRNIYDAMEHLLEEIYITVNSFNPTTSNGFSLHTSQLADKNKNDSSMCCT